MLTVRQLLRALGGGVGHRIVVGTPEAIADDIEAWFRAGAADGFNLMPDVLPEGLETFVDAVVPILQRRGLFRLDYAGRPCGTTSGWRGRPAATPRLAARSQRERSARRLCRARREATLAKMGSINKYKAITWLSEDHASIRASCD